MNRSGDGNPPGDRDRELARSSFGYARYSTIGLQFAFMLTLSIFAGHWADQRWGTEPWGTLAGAALGFGGGTVWLYRSIYSSEDSKKQQSRE